MRIKIILFLFTITLCCLTVNAQIRNFWKGSTGNWGTSTNWTQGIPPASNHLTAIDNGGTVIVDNTTTNAECSYIYVGDTNNNGGWSTDGNLVVNNGGIFKPLTLFIANGYAKGIVIVDGPTSKIQSTNSISISQGHGELRLLNGGTATAGTAVTTGDFPGAHGLISVGANSELSCPMFINIGHANREVFGILAGTGTVKAQNINFFGVKRGVLSPGDIPGAIGKLNITVTGNLDMRDDAVLQFDYNNTGSSPGINHDYVNITGSAVFGSSLNIELSSLTGGNSITRTIFSATGGISGTPISKLTLNGSSLYGSNRISSNIIQSGNNLNLSIGSWSNKIITWTGADATNPNLWDFLSNNWTGGADQFLNGDAVTINTTAASTINIEGTQKIVAGMTINNVDNLTINGNLVADASKSLGISGNSMLTKSGTGTLILVGTNDFKGGMLIQGGLINFSSIDNFGTGNITLNGGGLQWNTGSITDISGKLNAIGPGGATFNTNGNNITLASALTGTGKVTKTGNGTLTFGGNNTASGLLQHLEGTVHIQSKWNGNYDQAVGTNFTSANNAQISGNATFAGTIIPTGTLNVGRTTFNNAILQLGTGLGTNKIVGTSDIDITGGLSVDVDISSTPAGDYTLLEGSFTGTTDNVTLASPSERCAWFVIENNKLILRVLNGNTADYFCGGTGINTDPYQICTVEKLTELTALVNAGNSFSREHFILTADLDLSNIPNWTSIGTSANPFKGVFDGSRHTISNLKIASTESNRGLFGTIEDASISNLSVVNALVNGTAGGAWDYGIIAGLATNSNISGCYTSGNVDALGNVGGIAGLVSGGTLTDCYSAANIKGLNAGGIAGALTVGTAVTKCYSMNDVNGINDHAGGVAGLINASTLQNCVAMNAAITTTGPAGRIFGADEVGNSTFGNNAAFEGLLVNDGVITGGAADNKNGVNLTIAQLQTAAAYSSWDLTTTWTIRENNSHPYFTWQSAPAANVQATTSVINFELGNNADSVVMYKDNIRLIGFSSLMSGNNHIAYSSSLGDKFQLIVYEPTKASSYPVRFEVNNVTMAFNSMSGSIVDMQMLKKDTKATLPAPDPVKAGLTFAGWYCEAACTNAWDFNTHTVTQDTTLYAKWTATVTFDTQGGNTVVQQTVKEGYQATTPTAPTKTGLTFDGWFTEAACTNAWDFNTHTVTQDTTLYAKWNATVTFDTQGGSAAPSPQIVKEGDQATTPTAPTKTGLTFGGWYTEAACTNAWDFDTHTVTQDTMLYAKWNATVTFDTQGGSVAPSPQIVKEGYQATTPAVPSKTGLTFDGWYTEAACTNAWDFNTHTVTQDTTLYAKWNATVTFDSQGGSPVASQTVKEGDQATTPAVPSKTGLTFDGWYTEAACTNAWDFNTHTVTQDTTLYAKWTATVTFDTQGGGAVAQQTVKEGNKVTTPGVPTQAGFAFSGWYREAACTNVWEFDNNMVTQDTVLYAKWLQTFLITSSVGTGGSITPDGITNVVIGSSQSYTITPDNGYGISEVLIDGVNDPVAVSSGSYTFTNVTSSHTISVSFYALQFNIYATAGTGGEISPSGNITVNLGGSQHFDIIPNVNYEISEVLINGVNDPDAVSNGSYTFVNVSGGNNIEARFSYVPSADPTLNNISLSVGTLTPSFSSSVFNYRVTVANETDKITINAAPTDSRSTVTGNVTDAPLTKGENVFIITVTAENGGYYTYTITVFRNYPTGIDDVTAGILKIYPNPVESILTIEGTRAKRQAIKIVNTTGQLVYSGDARDETTTIDFSGYPKGTYLLHYDGKTIKVMKKTK